MKLGTVYTVEYMEERDSDWVFAEQADQEKATAKANSLWENPSVLDVRIVETTRLVWKSKSRRRGSTTGHTSSQEKY